MKIIEIKFSKKQFIVTVILTVILFCGVLYLIDLIFWKTKSLEYYIYFSIFYAILMNVFFHFISNDIKDIMPKLEENEQVKFKGKANFYGGLKSTAGALFLTDKKVIFRSHSLNIQKGQTNINYEDINGIIKRKTSYLIPNKIRVTIKNGQKFDFIVNNQKEWFEKLNMVMTSYQK
ncbi:MAG: hypothetical protein CSA38_02255 [Flavobacteriales bacterium]|nr:MAG: hypothetical protein CSA38_02255 [Flavobacteriales bacterium]